MISKDKISEILGTISSGDILNIYTYGSVVYGTNTNLSDEDYIIVVKDGVIESQSECNSAAHNTDIIIYTESCFKQKIEEHEISVLECLFLPDELKYEEIKFKFVLDKGRLRNAISAKCSNSWVKAKKKLIVEKDYNPYIAKKSLYHAFRIINFGWQIGKYKMIFYYKFNMLPEILAMPDDWDLLKAKYQSKFNYAISEFRKICPKEIKID